MNAKFKLVFTAILTGMAVIGSTLYSCSNEDELFETSGVDASTTHVDFVATLTNEQQKLLDDTGYPFKVDEQKNAWNSVISPTIPTTWGVFDDLRDMVKTRAVGIYGYYPAQYWTMLRVKLLTLPTKIKDAAILAIEEIENKTNVRFYNSIEDEEYYEPGHIKLPNISVRMNNGAVEGSGSFGLVGGEQYINVPATLEQASDADIKRFFLHAFCNAAGMFNEQQRNDRDNYVVIYLDNVKDNCKSVFSKITQNYTMQGAFDMKSITLAASKDYSKNNQNTIVKTGNYEIAINYTLSANDIAFLNGFYLPYIARTDLYIELDENCFYPNGQKLTEQERLELQNQLNAQRGLYGTPPIENRSQLVEW